MPEFGDALSVASLPFTTSQVVDLLDNEDLVVTIERKVVGEPVRGHEIQEPELVTADQSRLLGDVRDGLTHARISSGSASLPVLPGECLFDLEDSFPGSLAGLTESRFRRLPDLPRREVEDVDDLALAVLEGLRALPKIDTPALIHGDLTPSNVFVQDGRVCGVLDFGFMTAVGNPQFDAAITASIFDMYGPNASASEEILSEAFIARFGHEPKR